MSVKTQKIPSSILLSLFLLAICALPSGAFAASRALLIGVSAYPSSTSIADLHGPRNDVSLMWRYLRESGFSGDEIVVLADGIPEGPAFPASAAEPTYAAIIRELDALAAHDYQDGDMVVIYYSGHGTTLPQTPETALAQPEAGGRDQALLPADTGEWTDTGGLVNALVDDEIGEKLDAIRARGVDVWFVADACNSGGSTRATLGGEQTRYVDPALLGVPTQAFAAAEAAASQAGTRGSAQQGPRVMSLAGGGEDRRGGLVAFFAVDAFNLAVERPFAFADFQSPSVGEDDDGRKIGVFSNALHQALMTGNARTFGDLYDEMVARIASDPANSSRPRPVAEGDLARVIPWREASPVMLRGILDKGKLSVPAGIFQGFDLGAFVTLHDPQDPDTQLAIGSVAEATAAASIVSHLTWKDAERRVETMDVPVPVRLFRPAIRFTYKIGLPDNIDGLGAQEERIRSIFAAAFAEKDPASSTGVTVADPKDGDLNRLTHVSDGRLWLLYPGEAIPDGDEISAGTIGIDLGGADEAVAKALRDAVWKLARAERLVRMASGLRATGAGVLSARAEIYREESASGDGPCAWPQELMAGEDLSPAQLSAMRSLGSSSPAVLRNCDVVRVAMANRSLVRTDHYYVNGFYVDARGGILPLGLHGAAGRDDANCVYDLPPIQEGETPIHAGVTSWDDDAARHAGSSGLERIVILAIKRDPTGRPPNLCSLAQETLAETIDTRSALDKAAQRSELQSLLADVTGGTRNGMAFSRPAPQIEMQSFLFEFDLRR